MSLSVFEIFGYLVPSATILILGLIILLNDRRSRINQAFFIFVVFVEGWIVSLFFYNDLGYPNNILLLGRFNFAIASCVFPSLFLFTYLFPKKTYTLSKKIWIPVVTEVAFIFFLTFFTSLISKDELVTAAGGRATVFGILYYPFLLHNLLFLLAWIANLIGKYKRSDSAERMQIKTVFYGLVLTALIVIFTNVALPLLGDFSFQIAGPMAILVLVVFMTYAVLKLKVLNVKLITTQVFAITVSLILFVYIFFSRQIIDYVVRTSVFVLVSIFAYLIVKSVMREIEDKEQLKVLSRDLEKANSRLQKLDKTKSEFLSIASHQLRTPISGIKGYLSMILEGDFGKIEEKPKEILKSIYDNTERLNGLVNDFLDVSRIERGKLTMERKPTDISEMIQSIVTNFQPVADAKGIKLDYSPPKSSIPQLNVDSNKLRQVALNLVDNAIKYTNSGSIHVILEGLNDRFRVCVKDTGVGLDPDEAKNLFRPFVRTADSSKSNATGSGLGLYVARKIVQYHGGKVWAESEGKGKGSIFCMEVPYDQSTLPEPEPEPYLE